MHRKWIEVLDGGIDWRTLQDIFVFCIPTTIILSSNHFLQLPPIRNSDPGSHSRHSSSLPTAVRAFASIAIIIQHFFPLSTRVQLLKDVEGRVVTPVWLIRSVTVKPLNCSCPRDNGYFGQRLNWWVFLPPLHWLAVSASRLKLAGFWSLHIHTWCAYRGWSVVSVTTACPESLCGERNLVRRVELVELESKSDDWNEKQSTIVALICPRPRGTQYISSLSPYSPCPPWF